VKKARYAFAAAGVAPALGLMAPAATAAPVATHPQAHPAKTVRLGTGTPSPQYTCHPGSVHGAWSTAHHAFLFRITNYGHCVDAQDGLLEVRQSSLSERVRGYSKNGAMAFDRRVHGTPGKSYTVFPNSNFSSLNWNPVYQICAALVVSGTNTVRWGPVCITP
jgi:hypothetical protein